MKNHYDTCIEVCDKIFEEPVAIIVEFSLQKLRTYCFMFYVVGGKKMHLLLIRKKD
jgi:hypothetical protein